MTTYDYPVVDIHTHCWVDSFASRVLQHFLDNVHLPATFDGTFAGLKDSMDDAGIAASVVLSIIELMAGDSVISYIANFVKPIEILRGANGISIAVATVLAIKYFLEAGCSSDFDKAHQQ